MPGPLRGWKETIDIRIERAMEEYVDAAQNELETAFSEILPEIEAFFDDFRILRWKSSLPEIRPKEKGPGS
jgi:hypothetical protein